jgi:hypothetical protein
LFSKWEMYPLLWGYFSVVQLNTTELFHRLGIVSNYAQLMGPDGEFK